MGSELTVDSLIELLNDNKVINIVSSGSRDALAATSILIKTILNYGKHFRVQFKDFPVNDQKKVDITIDNHGFGLKSGKKSCSQKAYNIAKKINEKNKNLGFLAILGSQKILNQEKYIELISEITEDNPKLKTKTDSNLYGKYGKLKNILLHPYNPRFPGLNRERAVKKFLEKRDLDPEEKFYNLDDQSRSDFNSALVMYLMRNEQKRVAQNLISENVIFKTYDDEDPRRYANDYSLLLESISSRNRGKSIGFTHGNQIDYKLTNYLKKIKDKVSETNKPYIESDSSISYGLVNALLKNNDVSLTISSNSEKLMVLGMSNTIDISERISRVTKEAWGTSRMTKAFIEKGEKEDLLEEVIQ